MGNMKFLLLISLLISNIVFAKDIILYPIFETEPVFTSGDAADDPAFWYNQVNPEQSIVFGTDKKAGIHAFALNGKRIKFIPSGKINNIDIRKDFKFGAKAFSIMMGSNQDNNSIIAYLINDQGEFDIYNQNEILTEFNSVYGFCLYRSPETNFTYAFISDAKSLTINQYHILSIFPLKGSLVRQIKTQSTSEGCVADDETGILYFAQEDEHSGVYFINADPNTKNNDIGKIDLISKKGGFINGDTEGLAILRYEENKLLFASSQSSDDFTVYDLNNKNKFIGRVSVGKKNEIDGISKTDGIEIFSGKINQDFKYGILIAQDDMNMEKFNLKEKEIQATKVNQNFKIVSIDKIIDEFFE